MTPLLFGVKVAENMMGQPSASGDRSQELINKLRSQGIRSGHWANNGAGGFSATRINTPPPAGSAAARWAGPTPGNSQWASKPQAQAQPAAAPAPAAAPTQPKPPSNVIKRVNRGVF